MFGDSFSREARSGFHLRRYGSGREAYDVAVSVPGEPAPARGFPLLVVLDAALHFDAVAAAARALSRRADKTGVAPMVAIGIASGIDWSHDAARRERDLPPGGEGHAGLSALVDRVIGDVATLAPVDPARRAILGHSFGGLFALDALGGAGRFDRCIAVSPSLWRAPGLAGRLADRVAGRGTRILIVSGDREMRINADLPAATRALSRTAQVRTVALPGEDHGSIPFAALPMALRFLNDVTR